LIGVFIEKIMIHSQIVTNFVGNNLKLMQNKFSFV
jgi:hypothetical protein